MSESWADLAAAVTGTDLSAEARQQIRDNVDATLVGYLSDLRIASPPPPSGEEIMANIRRLSEPSMTVLVRPADAERVRRAVGDVWLGLAVRVVESEFVPAGEMVVIDHAGGNSGERVTLRA